MKIYIVELPGRGAVRAIMGVKLHELDVALKAGNNYFFRDIALGVGRGEDDKGACRTELTVIIKNRRARESGL